MYSVIPIFKEPFLHPLHENNGLSALWVQPESAEKPFFIIQKHPDSDDILQDYKWLDEELIITPDKKILNHFNLSIAYMQTQADNITYMNGLLSTSDKDRSYIQNKLYMSLIIVEKIKL